jgi:hypothetical protein
MPVNKKFYFCSRIFVLGQKLKTIQGTISSAFSESAEGFYASLDPSLDSA